MGHRNLDQLTSTVDRKGSVGRNQIVRSEDVEVVVEIFAVNLYNLIALLEAEVFCKRADFHLSRAIDIVLREVQVAHEISQADEDQNTDDHIHSNTSEHDDQALPGRLAPELPGLRRLFHSLGVERLVDHSRNLHVTPKRNSTYRVFSFTLSERPKFGWETNGKLFHPHPKVFGCQQMPQLVYRHQERKAQQKLANRNQNIHQLISSSALIRVCRSVSI